MNNLIRERIKKFTIKSDFQAFIEMFVTFIPFIFLWLEAVKSFENDNLYTWLLMTTLAALFLVRIFIIQHDCSHRAFFKSKKINDWVGRFCALFTLTPYEFWRVEHSQHHVRHGNLEERGISDIWMMTKNEYMNSSKLKRLLYKLYRNPLILLVFGPIFIFVIKRRFPTGLAMKNNKVFNSIVLLNVFIFIFYYFIYREFGLDAMLYVALPMMFIASSVGVFIFVVQHNHEHSYWKHKQDWDFDQASLKGSTVLRFGELFDWLTSNIAYHNIHHLNPNIPCYNLKSAYLSVQDDIPNTELSLQDAILSLKWKLWDETKNKMIVFSEVHINEHPI